MGRRMGTVAVAVWLSLVACTQSRDATDSARHSPTPGGTAISDLVAAPIEVSERARKVGETVGFDVEAATSEALDRTLEFFPDNVPNISVDVRPHKTHGIGIYGYTTPATGQIVVYLNPDYGDDFGTTLRRSFRPTVVHELDHSERIYEGPGYGHTLGEAMVSEGLGVAFSIEAYPRTVATRFTSDIPAKRLGELWVLARAHLNDTDWPKVHARWFFGEGNLPDGTGYALGYAIVRAYIDRHPGATPHELTLVSARKILRGSHYGD